MLSMNIKSYGQGTRRVTLAKSGTPGLDRIRPYEVVFENGEHTRDLRSFDKLSEALEYFEKVTDYIRGVSGEGEIQ